MIDVSNFESPKPSRLQAAKWLRKQMRRARRTKQAHAYNSPIPGSHKKRLRMKVTSVLSDLYA